MVKYAATTFAGFNGLLSGSVSASNQLILAGNGSGSVLWDNPALAGQAYYKDGVLAPHSARPDEHVQRDGHPGDRLGKRDDADARPGSRTEWPVLERRHR
jgi:hypothetical protein